MKLRGPAFLSLTLAVGQVVGLIRVQMIARFLGTEIQGQAVAIGLISGFFVSVLAVNTTWQLVQSRREDLNAFQSSLQGVAVLRGAITSVLLCVVGTFALEYLKQPELKLPLYAIAACPFIEGFTHLDPWRKLRDGSFKSLALFQLAGPVGSIIVALIAMAIMQSIWVVVFVSIGTSIFRVIGSHLVAARRFRLRLHRKHAGEIVRFGLPLLPAGLMFWANSQSDKVVMFLGERYESIPVFTDAEIGSYGTVAGMVLLPRGLFVTVMQSVFIPRLSQAREDRTLFRRNFAFAVMGSCALATLIVTGGRMAGDSVFLILLGEQYSLGASVAPLLISAMGVQILRTATYESSIAVGRTSVTAVGNTFRLISIPISLVLLSKGYGVVGLAWSVYIGELISTLAAVLWIQATAIRHSWMILVSLALVVIATFTFGEIGRLTSDLDDLARVSILVVTYILILGPVALCFQFARRRRIRLRDQTSCNDQAFTGEREQSD